MLVQESLQAESELTPGTLLPGGESTSMAPWPFHQQFKPWWRTQDTTKGSRGNGGVAGGGSGSSGETAAGASGGEHLGDGGDSGSEGGDGGGRDDGGGGRDDGGESSGCS